MYASINGLRMYYEIHGPPGGDRVPLLLLHGGGSTIETSFGKLLPLLSQGRALVAFEQQGHGRTADVDRPFSFEQSAADAVALLRYLKVPRADLFGYSNGGHIALQIALDHPEVVRKLILESMMYSREGAAAEFWQGFDHATLADMPEELKEAYRQTAPHPENLPGFFDKSVARMRGMDAGANPVRESAHLARHGRPRRGDGGTCGRDAATPAGRAPRGAARRGPHGNRPALAAGRRARGGLPRIVPLTLTRRSIETGYGAPP